MRRNHHVHDHRAWRTIITFGLHGVWIGVVTSGPLPIEIAIAIAVPLCAALGALAGEDVPQSDDDTSPFLIPPMGMSIAL